MLDRIQKNEQRLDSANAIVQKLMKSLEEFDKTQKDISLLNRYYGSQNWFLDKEAYEENRIPKIKAGVLSEDAVWNMNEEIKELIQEMKRVVKKYEK